jgi:hypothetical protein
LLRSKKRSTASSRLPAGEEGLLVRFASELQVNIDDPKYAASGGSKGKRLRYFLQTCDDATAVRTLTALREHRGEYLARSGGKDPVANAETRYQGLISRLSGDTAPQRPAASPQPTAVDQQTIVKIKADLLQVTVLAPHARGYAFEGFLKGLFDAFGLAAQEPFRLRGGRLLPSSPSRRHRCHPPTWRRAFRSTP